MEEPEMVVSDQIERIIVVTTSRPHLSALQAELFAVPIAQADQESGRWCFAECKRLHHKRIAVHFRRGPQHDAEDGDLGFSAQDVFDHLPAELQTAIESEPPTWEERQTAKDNALPVQPRTRGRSKLFMD